MPELEGYNDLQSPRQTLNEKSTSRLDVLVVEGDDVKSIFVERKFGGIGDYVELHIADLNNQILKTIPNYLGYRTPRTAHQGKKSTDLLLNPKKILEENHYSIGKFKIIANIQRQRIFAGGTSEFQFKINEVSPSRTEIRLTTAKPNTELENSSRSFINEVKNSPYLRDFTLNFGENLNIVGLNISLDKSNPKQYSLLIKLLKPLPPQIGLKTRCNIVEDIVDPIEMVYNLGEPRLTEPNIPLRGPNFKIDVRLNSAVPTELQNYNEILKTESSSSLQKLLSKLDGYNPVEIFYDYIKPVPTSSLDFLAVTPSHFENFIHFGSAVERIKNFSYKLRLISEYDEELAHLRTIAGTSATTIEVLEATASLESKKENIIQKFDGYEQFLYFETGSNLYTWPKINASEPYNPYHPTSSEALTWVGSNETRNPYYGGQMVSASVFDSQNPNRLNKLTPGFIGDDFENNESFMLFCDIIGNHFDPIWTSIKDITSVRDSSHTYGISKDIVYHALKGLGIETYDQFENQDLQSYIFGKPFTTTDTATVITASNETFSQSDITKDVWKRIYHNLAYLLKTKGTERGLRALINCYGIPDTILDIKEYGSAHPDRDNYKLYSYNKYLKTLTGNSAEHEGFFLETQWSSSISWEHWSSSVITNPASQSAKTVEFRILPHRSDDQYHLFSLSGSVSSSDLHLLLHPYTGSTDFYGDNDRTLFGKLELHQYTESIASSSYFPVYNGRFWDIFLGTEGASGSADDFKFGAYQSNHLREVSYHTQSVSITEAQRAQSFGDVFSGSAGAPTAFLGGIKNFGTPVTHSMYFGGPPTTENTGSAFNLEYSGSFSEFRYYFGELLSHDTLTKHALEPLMYAGNSVSSSYDYLLLRYPLSFELDLDHSTDTQLPSSSFAWNFSPTDEGLVSPANPLVGPITGGAILSASGDNTVITYTASIEILQNDGTYVTYSGQPFSSSAEWINPPSGSAIDLEDAFEQSVIFTVGGTPLLQSHHPNEKVTYMNGFSFMGSDNIILMEEEHHLPTPNTVGKSPVNRKIQIDSGSTDDDILSRDQLSQLPTIDRQASDFSNIGVFLSPQNEINEDIIYTLGTFSLDQFLGDPRDQISESYPRINELHTQYFKKLEKGSQRQNIFDFTRWIQFNDHTLFESMKHFVPQKATSKTGLLIEPHFLERTKFRRYHPIHSSHLYEADIKELDRPLTASFSMEGQLKKQGASPISFTSDNPLGTLGVGIVPATAKCTFEWNSYQNQVIRLQSGDDTEIYYRHSSDTHLSTLSDTSYSELYDWADMETPYQPDLLVFNPGDMSGGANTGEWLAKAFVEAVNSFDGHGGKITASLDEIQPDEYPARATVRLQQLTASYGVAGNNAIIKYVEDNTTPFNTSFTNWDIPGAFGGGINEGGEYGSVVVSQHQTLATGSDGRPLDKGYAGTISVDKYYKGRHEYDAMNNNVNGNFSAKAKLHFPTQDGGQEIILTSTSGVTRHYVLLDVSTANNNGLSTGDLYKISTSVPADYPDEGDGLKVVVRNASPQGYGFGWARNLLDAIYSENGHNGLIKAYHNWTNTNYDGSDALSEHELMGIYTIYLAQTEPGAKGETKIHFTTHPTNGPAVNYMNSFNYPDINGTSAFLQGNITNAQDNYSAKIAEEWGKNYGFKIPKKPQRPLEFRMRGDHDNDGTHNESLILSDAVQYEGGPGYGYPDTRRQPANLKNNFIGARISNKTFKVIKDGKELNF